MGGEGGGVTKRRVRAVSMFPSLDEGCHCADEGDIETPRPTTITISLSSAHLRVITET